jgi:hypothetical protein
MSNGLPNSLLNPARFICQMDWQVVIGHTFDFVIIGRKKALSPLPRVVPVLPMRL